MSCTRAHKQRENGQWVQVFPSALQGEIFLPPSKSHTMRALLFSAMSYGSSSLTNLLVSQDTKAMINGLRLLGAHIDVSENTGRLSATIQGIGNRSDGGIAIRLSQEDKIQGLDVGNSGQALRFLTPFFAMQPYPVTVTGDRSIQTLRSMQALAQALTRLEGNINFLKRDGFAPFQVSGNIQHGHLEVDGTDSQPVSALLMSLPFLPAGSSTIHVSPMGEKPWVLFTLWWLKKVGIPFSFDDVKNIFEIQGGNTVDPFTYMIPPDMSALAFPLVLSCLTESDCIFHGIDLDDPQGDKRIIDIVQQMGANVQYNTLRKSVRVTGKPDCLSGIDIDMRLCIDALPILGVIAAHAKGTTRLLYAEAARCKESDRIRQTAVMLSKIGVKVEERSDSLCIHGLGSPPKLSQDIVFDSASDHRMAMAQAVCAASLSQDENKRVILGPIECISKSFPKFFETLSQSGLRYERAV